MVNGKMRAKVQLSADLNPKEIEEQALAHPNVQKWTEGKTPKKVIVVPKKIVNVVVQFNRREHREKQTVMPADRLGRHHIKYETTSQKRSGFFMVDSQEDKWSNDHPYQGFLYTTDHIRI